MTPGGLGLSWDVDHGFMPLAAFFMKENLELEF